MWWLIGSAPDFWGRGPGFESGISHNDPGALQDHCAVNLRVEGGEPQPKAKKIGKNREKNGANSHHFLIKFCLKSKLNATFWTITVLLILTTRNLNFSLKLFTVT